jgi:hypothetical protein
LVSRLEVVGRSFLLSEATTNYGFGRGRAPERDYNGRHSAELCDGDGGHVSGSLADAVPLAR